ncbi:MAG: DEAD/DEAH box helicase, partial [Salinibacterium sp.]|nr:DEAD/DEAH box helicase [Salinibacterium sp.]
TGLNLTAADLVFLLDPWWNPAAESQAIARAHRIGRQGSVHALRIVSRGTVEESILALQDQKRELARSILDDQTEGRSARLDLDELRALIG